MFITNGKSLFGNTGLIVSIIILVVLLILSYNKCYLGNNEGFDPVGDMKREPINVRLNISGGTITLNFTVDNKGTDKILPVKFLTILSQYDSNMKNTGNNEIFFSTEYELNASVEKTEKNIDTNLCVILNGRPICKRKFENLEVRDSQGNLYYYKIGIMPLYAKDDGYENGRFIFPGNIQSSNGTFTLDSTAENQSRQFNDFKTFQTMIKEKDAISANIYDNTMATADGQYELIKSQMGGYPDNLLMDSLSLSQGTLNDLVGRTMAPIIINANVR